MYYGRSNKLEDVIGKFTELQYVPTVQYVDHFSKLNMNNLNLFYNYVMK